MNADSSIVNALVNLRHNAEAEVMKREADLVEAQRLLDVAKARSFALRDAIDTVRSLETKP